MEQSAVMQGSTWAILPWLQAAGVVGLGLGGLLLGRWISRRSAPVWWLGYGLPLLAVVACGAAYRYPPLEFVVPFSWCTAGRRELVLLAFGGALLFGTLMPRLPQRRLRILIAGLIGVIVLTQAAWPFLAPAFNRKHLAGLVTRYDADGICLQNTDYTCGPAAAVTALRRVGLAAEEGALAMLFATTGSTGTPADILAARLNAAYAADGLRATHRVFRSVAELRGETPALAWVKFSFMADHVVAVLEVTMDGVELGDPFQGRRVLTHAEFEQEWRFVGVTLRRVSLDGGG